MIGYIGGHALDFGVYDWEVSLPGLINPEAYTSREPWKIHTVDPFQYYPKEIRDELLSKMIRSVEPRAGKIDYDVDGTPSGTRTSNRNFWRRHRTARECRIGQDQYGRRFRMASPWKLFTQYARTWANPILVSENQAT